MELIKISASKLKIMLSVPDMQKYDLEADCIDCADEHTREAFRHIFDDAGAQVDFRTEGERLFIQLYTSRGGGCEIFVTKLGPKSDARFSDAPQSNTSASLPSDSELTLPERALLEKVFGDRCVSSDCGEQHNGKELGMKERQAYIMTSLSDSRALTSREGEHLRTVVFSFDSIEELLAVCRRLRHIDFFGESHAYIGADRPEIYYLILRIPSVNLYRLSDKFVFLSEYGTRLSADVTEKYLSEHSKKLCDGNAVELLGQC